MNNDSNNKYFIRKKVQCILIIQFTIDNFQEDKI